VESAQVAIRLPRIWIDQFRKSEGGVSRAIQERLARSTMADETDPKFRELAGEIEQLARRVRRLYGSEWYEDGLAHQTFIKTIARLLNALPEPPTRTAKVSFTPEQAAEFIFKDHVEERKEFMAGKSFHERPSIKTLLGNGDD
jgi:hypothetical protein